MCVSTKSLGDGCCKVMDHKSLIQPLTKAGQKMLATHSNARVSKGSASHLRRETKLKSSSSRPCCHVSGLQPSPDGWGTEC